MLQASAAVDFSGERAQKMTMASIAETIARRIAALGDPVRALGASRYFKTGPGEYGEGDIFAGVTTPQMRALVKEFWRDTAWDAVPELLASPVHEVRSAGLAIWVKRYEKGAQDEREAIYASYLAHTSRINNWDLVDISAPGIVGAHLLESPRGILRTLAKSPFLWERRIAIIATLAFIRKGEFDDTLEIAALLKTDHEDLIHKAPAGCCARWASVTARCSKHSSNNTPPPCPARPCATPSSAWRNPLANAGWCAGNIGPNDEVGAVRRV